jgi:hypothetical protein
MGISAEAMIRERSGSSASGACIPYIPVAAGTMLVTTLLVVLATRKVLRWAAHTRWGTEQRLALASGAIGFFILLAPLVEFAVHPPGRISIGMSGAALIWLGGLIWLGRHMAREPG